MHPPTPPPTRFAAATDCPRLYPKPGNRPVEWQVSTALIDYPSALATMQARAAAIAAGAANECVWLLEHPALYTSGTSAREPDLLDARFPVFVAGRGGQFTYHGPGQRVAYVMLDLDRRRRDVRALVAALEQWIIATLATFGVIGERRLDRVGVWVVRPDKPVGEDGAMAEDKIAAIGIRIRRWVSFHGISINRAPNLDHFGGIVPCGILQPHFGVTSLADLGVMVSPDELDEALRRSFSDIFGPTI